jgi:hypothetical protein
MNIQINSANPTINFEAEAYSAVFFVTVNARPVVAADGKTIRTFAGYPAAADFADRVANGFEPILTAALYVARFTN